MSRYYVGHLVEDAAVDYYRNITTELAEEFGIGNLSERSPAHMTLKPPFSSSSSIATFKEDLTSIAKKNRVIPYTIRGFGSFGTASIFLAVEPNKELQEAAERVSGAIDAFGEDRDPALPVPLKLHVSVARHLTPEIHAKVWKYLKELPEPVFENSFGNLALLRQNGEEKWHVEEVYRFGE